MNEIKWSLRIKHLQENKNGFPKLEGGPHPSSKKVCDLLNKKFQLEVPFTEDMLEEIYNRSPDGAGFKMELITKKGKRCSVSLWSDARLDVERNGLARLDRNYQN
jgi:hypothetical protein